MGTKQKQIDQVVESGLVYGFDPHNPAKGNATSVTPAGAMYVFDTSANGYDPSIGRMPVEMSNNYQYLRMLNNAGTVAYQSYYGTTTNLAAATWNFVVKAAPGYLKRITIRNNADFATATLTSVVLSDTNTGTAGRIFQLGIPSVGTDKQYNFDLLLTTGVNFIFTFSAFTGCTAGDIEFLIEYR